MAGVKMTQVQRSNFEANAPAAASVAAVRGELTLSLPLRHVGQADVRLRYELVGPTGAPLLIVAGGISAGRHAVASGAYPEPGWWQSQSESFESHRLLSIDWLGADGELDQPIDPADQADALAALLQALDLGPAAAFVGASYGGMVGMHLAARHPRGIGALLAISASARPHPFSSARRSLQRRAVVLGESTGDPEAGVALARAMAMLTYRTPQEFAERFDAPPTVKDGRVRVAADAYLDSQGERHCRKMGAAAYRRLSESIDLHRIDASDLSLPVTLVAVDHDTLVPAADVRAFADELASARFHLVRSRFGHDAFLKEDEQVATILSHFFASLEHAQ
jgi:homoserine O-acetyltransferase